MHKKLVPLLTVIVLIISFTPVFANQEALARVPGLPFTEDFTDTALKDANNTTANWSTEEGALTLNWEKAKYGVFKADLVGSDVSNDMHSTYAIALGDVDGDGDLDMLEGNRDEPKRLYKNNGTDDPFSGVTGTDISNDAHYTRSIALGDVDGDGDLDMVAGNYGQANRLYLNNGTADPFSGATGTDISSDAHGTYSITLGDLDGDGDLDILAGNYEQANRLYLNNGSADPFNGVTGTEISGDIDSTTSIALGDMDGDDDLDMLAGNNNQTNRLYLNNGTADPFNGVTGTEISGDMDWTRSIALGDVDGDGDLDMLAGNNNQTNRLYLNNGTATPFSGVTGTEISGDMDLTPSIALGDVDGDGDLDMLAGNRDQTNRLYLNNGTADPFSGVTGTDISSDVHDTWSIALGDMDGDGDLDLIAGNKDQTNRLYLNEGTADPFSGVTGTDISSDVHVTFSIALGDVDGDGDLDMVEGNANHTNRLYLNNGTSDPFNGVTGMDISSDAHYTNSITLGDVDSDGDLDMLAGNYNSQTNRLYLNNGTADPFNGVIGTDISSDTNDTFSIALGDVDGDGDLDMLAGNNNQTNRLYLNNGTTDPFSGVTGTDISSDVQSTYSIALGDVDRDGDLDMLAGNYNSQTNRLYLNNGTADPFNGVTPTNVSSDAHNTLSITLGDVDGDGDLDMLAGNHGQTNRLYLNNGTADPFNGVIGTDIGTDAHGTYSIALGDLDRDGDLDMLAGNYGQTNRLYKNNGTADPFGGVTGMDINSDAHNTTSIALGDVDGDGDLDMLAGNNVQTNRLYLNRHTASPFRRVISTDISTDTHATRSIAIADVDGDGDLDMLAGNYNNQTNRMYKNNGTADPFSGVTGTDISSDDAHWTTSIVLVDVDGDGDLDMLAGNLVQTNRLYMNNGTADPFSGVTGTNISSDTYATFSIALGDVDGDGDLDMLAGNWDQTNRLYLNNGTTDPFSGVTGTDISSDAHGTYSIALGDVDGDGNLDMVAGNYGQPNRLYLNNGTADPFNGVTGTDISSDAHYTTAIALGDVDGDGDLDMLKGNYDQPNRLYLNNGTADPFSGVTGMDISGDAHSTLSIALGDVDGDGDLDMLAGNWDQPNRLVLNNGSADPFSGVTGTDISSDAHWTYSIALGDMDGDGDLDMLAGNYTQTNRLYLQAENYHIAQGLATSLRIDTETSNIPNATLTATAELPNNTSVTYYLSNNGGVKWYIVQPGVNFVFPTSGMDLRWKAELHSLSPILTPKIDQIQISMEGAYYNYLPLTFR